MKILVLGATGKVGAATLAELRILGHSPMAAARSATSAAKLLAQGYATRHLDLDDATTLPAALADIDAAFLVTGYHVDMLRQSMRFLNAAKTAGVRHIVHLGTTGAPTDEVGHWDWHRYIEAYIEKLGFTWTHLRPECFMQNIVSEGYSFLQPDGRILNYVGDAVWSWVDTADLGAVAARALADPVRFAGQTIPLGYDAKTFAEVAAILSAEWRRPIYAERHTPEEFFAGAMAGGADPAYMTCIRDHFHLFARFAIPGAEKTYDNFAAITGRPPTTWRDFARRHRPSA